MSAADAVDTVNAAEEPFGANATAVYLRRNCRLCGSNLSFGFSLGEQFISQFPPTGQPPAWPRIPLTLMMCDTCHLVQLQHTAPRDWLYREYWYRSAVNESMVKALAEIVVAARREVKLSPADWVCDIGANDGTLLHLYWMLGHKEWEDARGELIVPQRLAFEPAMNLQDDLHGRCELVVPDYFPPRRYDGPQAKIVTSVAMFYDLDQPDEFVKEMKRLLADDGLWIIQYSDLRTMYEQNAWDSICHEHLEYYGLRPVLHLLRRHGFGVQAVERNDVNGGSVRLYVRKGRHAEEALALGDQEEREGYYDLTKLQLYGMHLHTGLEKVRQYLSGRTVDIYGASTKGNTYLQVLGWGQFRRALERSPAKWGRSTVTGVPIVGEEEGRKDPAEVYLVLPWHFRAGVLERERELLERGTKFLFPLPRPEVVGKDDVEVL